jgi:hypothetical protein
MTFDHHVRLRYDLVTGLDRCQWPPSDPLAGRRSCSSDCGPRFSFTSKSEPAWLHGPVEVTPAGPRRRNMERAARLQGKGAGDDRAADDARARPPADAAGFPMRSTHHQPWRGGRRCISTETTSSGARLLDSKRVDEPTGPTSHLRRRSPFLPGPLLASWPRGQRKNGPSCALSPSPVALAVSPVARQASRRSSFFSRSE